MDGRHSLSLLLLLLLLLLLTVLSLWELTESVFLVFWYFCLPKTISVLHKDFLEAMENKNIILNVVLKGSFWFMFWSWKDACVVYVFFGKIGFPLISWNFLNVRYPITQLYHVHHIFCTFSLNIFLVWLWYMKYKYKIDTKQITLFCTNKDFISLAWQFFNVVPKTSNVSVVR